MQCITVLHVWPTAIITCANFMHLYWLDGVVTDNKSKYNTYVTKYYNILLSLNTEILTVVLMTAVIFKRLAGLLIDSVAICACGLEQCREK